MNPTELIFRHLLWLNHGCPVTHLYGDDGEMQCSACAIDFKRWSAGEIATRLAERRLKALRILEGE